MRIQNDFSPRSYAKTADKNQALHSNNPSGNLNPGQPIPPETSDSQNIINNYQQVPD